ncbi:MAG: hypothetical protein U0996_19155 [Planctomycetaceae bacterium]
MSETLPEPLDVIAVGGIRTMWKLAVVVRWLAWSSWDIESALSI